MMASGPGVLDPVLDRDVLPKKLHMQNLYQYLYTKFLKMYNQTHSEFSKMNTHFSPAFENLRPILKPINKIAQNYIKTNTKIVKRYTYLHVSPLPQLLPSEKFPFSFLCKLGLGAYPGFSSDEVLNMNIYSYMLLNVWI